MSSALQSRLASVGVTYRPVGGELVETGFDRVSVAEVIDAGPVREFRWYKGRTYYSGWYWSATTGGMVVYESRLELSVDRTTCGSPPVPDGFRGCGG